MTATGLREKIVSLGKYKGLADLRPWVSNANHYIGEEKQFVDRIVARNPNVVDLEMALPAYSQCKALINRFVEEKGDVCFWQISWPVAEILADLGCSINEMVANYNFSGPAPAKRNLRRAYNRHARLRVRHTRMPDSVVELAGT